LVISFLFGVTFGSFFNVVIYRSLNEKSFKKRSFCPNCKQGIKFYDLIPIVSFLILSGKCRNCKKPISVRYPLVETVFGVLLVLITYTQLGLHNYSINFDLFFDILIWFLGISSILIIAYLDYLTGLIYDSVLIPAILVIVSLKFLQIISNILIKYITLTNNDFGSYLLKSGFIENLVRYSLSDFIWLAIIAILTSSFFLFLIILTLGKGIGFGDVKFGFLIGFLLGLNKTIVALFLTFFIGAVLSVFLIILKKKKFGQTIPLGPFLALGAIISLFFGNQLFSFYVAVLK